ncbi:MAG: YHS domain-containing (seleno)protein [Halioglobus sp.]
MCVRLTNLWTPEALTMRYTLATLALFLSVVAMAEQQPSHPQCAADGVAVGGYDLVSYHSAGGPVMGSTDSSAKYGGLLYNFSSPSNLKTFEEDPEQYLPVYSGWCAATLAMGRLACPDYTNFKLENGRLLLFELAGFTNGRTVWNSDPVSFRQRADENFTKLVAPSQTIRE